MPSKRIQRRIDSLLDEADEATASREWKAVREIAGAVLAIEGENEDALAFLAMADGATSDSASPADDAPPSSPAATPAPTAPPHPERFAGDRYGVRRHLGDGGTKRVLLVRDTRLDREVALALVRTEGVTARSDGRSRRSRAISDASRARA